MRRVAESRAGRGTASKERAPDQREACGVGATLVGVCHLLLLSTAGGTPGQSDTHARQLGLDVSGYVFQLTLSDEHDEIVGETTILARLRDGAADEWVIDLVGRSPEAQTGMTVDSVEWLEGEAVRTVEFVHDGDRLRIPLDRAALAGELRRVRIRYRGVPATGLIIGQNRYGDRTFFSDNWPNKARHWLPTIDHPYDKAESEMIVTAPAHYQVVSNGLMVEETDLPDGRRRTHWKQSVPIATWLYALGVARFAVSHWGELDGVPLETWVFAQDRDAGFYDFAEPTRQVLEFFSDRIGPYPYERLANVQTNSVRGGMEAATSLFYDDDSVTGERTERWRNVVIHEIAHQWWGNSVTEADWDDVWLSEGFATYFTLLFIEHAYGRDRFVAALENSRDRVFGYEEAHPGETIVHDNLDDMSKVTSTNTYQKGAWVLHMLRGMIGDETFWAGIRDYYATYRDANATTDDFRRVMEEASGEELEWFFDQWLSRAGFPEIEARWSYDSDEGQIDIRVDQVQESAEPYRLPVTLAATSTDGERTVVRLWVEGRGNEYAIDVSGEPTSLSLDPGTWVLMRANVASQ